MTHKGKLTSKLISILLSATLAITMLPAAALANSASELADSPAQVEQAAPTQEPSSDIPKPEAGSEEPSNVDEPAAIDASAETEASDDQATPTNEDADADDLVVSLLGTNPAQLDGEYATDEVIIVYEDEAIDHEQPIELDGTDETIALTDIGVEDQETLVADAETPQTGDVVLAKLDEETPVELAVAQISQIPGVLSVQPNYIYRLAATTEPNPVVTNDTYYSSQYYLSNTKASSAWRVARTSTEVTVAVLDTGCDLTHLDLKDNLLTDLAWDCTTSSTGSPLANSSVKDPDGHGTQVCGVVAAKANNSRGIAGVSYDANILPMKVFNDKGEATTDTLVIALNKIAAYAKAKSAKNLKVVNMSLGGYDAPNDETLHNSIKTLHNTYNINIVCAGGNGDKAGNPIISKSYPADYDECISVTSLTRYGTHSTWSDYNAYKDISAPGEGIYTTAVGGGYASNSGTSFSAPVVSGVVALLLAAKPSATPAQIYSAICDSATTVPGAARPNDGSKGAINALGALTQLAVDTSAAYYTDMSFTVDYDKNISCNTPTKFTVNAVGGSGHYNYMLDTIYSREKDDNDLLIDPSHGKGYGSSSILEFTFMASGTYEAWFYVQDARAHNYIRQKVTLVVNDPDYPSIGEIADSVAAECRAKNFATDYDKALWLHDWVLDHCSYDKSLRYCNSEGVFARGTGTCESYHRAYSILLGRMGIDTGRMEGNGHVWTAVKMDDKWYQVDATWDDPGYESSSYPDLQHMYFGLNDELMQMVHPAHKPTAPYVSNSLDCNYFIKTGKIKTYSKPFKADIQSQLNNGKVSFSLLVSTTGWAATEIYRKIIYSLVAFDLTGEKFNFNGNEIGFDVRYSNNNLVFNSTFFGTSGAISQGWKTGKDGQWYYVKSDGSLQKGWIKLNNAWYYLHPDTGVMQTSWLNESGSTYYLLSGGAMCVGFRTIDGKDYAFDGSGCMIKGWYNIAGANRYFTQDGSAAVGDIMVDGKKSCFQVGGIPMRGWLKKDEGVWCYFDDNGAYQKGWQKVGTHWFYLSSSDGVMATGLLEVGDRTYYLHPTDGRMLTGWNKIDDKWYYFSSEGSMQKGWAMVNGRWFYLDPADGRMATGLTDVGESTYYLHPTDGRMLTGWNKVDGDWYYFSSEGSMQKGWAKVNGRWFYLDPADGRMAGGLKEVDGRSYYLHPTDGRMLTGWNKIDDKWYYFSPEGSMVKNEWIGQDWVGDDGAWAPFAKP